MSNAVSPPQPTGWTAVWFALFYAGAELVKWVGGTWKNHVKHKEQVAGKTLEEVNRLAGWQDSLTSKAMDRIEKLEARELDRDRAHQEMIEMLNARHATEVKELSEELSAARAQVREAMSTLATCNTTIANLTLRVSELERENIAQLRLLIESGIVTKKPAISSETAGSEG